MGKKNKKQDSGVQNMVLGALVVALLAIGAYIFVLRDDGQNDAPMVSQTQQMQGAEQSGAAAPPTGTAPPPANAPAATTNSAPTTRNATASAGVNTPGGGTESIVATYNAIIGDTDTYNSQGDKLTDLGGIIQQDRANFHRGLGQDGELDDGYFSSKANRAKIPAMVKRGSIDPQARQAMQTTPAAISVVVIERNGVMEMKIN